MSWLKRPCRPDLRASLKVLRRCVTTGGEPLFCVVGPGEPRQEFATFAEADNRAADLASLNPGEQYFSQERRVLDGVHVLLRSRIWQFDLQTGGVYGF